MTDGFERVSWSTFSHGCTSQSEVGTVDRKKKEQNFYHSLIIIILKCNIDNPIDYWKQLCFTVSLIV